MREGHRRGRGGLGAHGWLGCGCGVAEEGYVGVERGEESGEEGVYGGEGLCVWDCG